MSGKHVIELTDGQLRALNSACALYSASAEAGEVLETGSQVQAFYRAWDIVQAAMRKAKVTP